MTGDAADSGGASDLIRVLGDGAGAEATIARRAAARARARDAGRKARAERTEWRLGLICLFFFLGYGLLAGRMTYLAASEPAEPRVAAAAETERHAGRAAITDRKGRLLAANLPTWSIYAHPRELARAGVSPETAARRLAGAVSGIDEERLRARFARRKGLVWVKRPATPTEKQAAHDLGLPGVYFGRRETRIYPAGRIGAHILGGARIGQESVSRAEVIGRAGVERALDAELRDPAREGRPLALSVDLAAQTTLTRVMEAALERFSAKSGSAVLMSAKTGEVIAMVSLPDFDPNERPNPNDPEIAKTRPLMNRAAEGVYELGSTFKIFAAALAMEEGLYGPQSLVDTRGPLKIGRYRINDFHEMPPQMTLRDVIVESSNVGTSRLALAFGPEKQRAFLGKLGFLEPTGLEVAEARIGRPLLPERWGKLASMTISYGHGLAATQLHLASAYASLVNGGLRVEPTLRLGAPAPTEADRVVRPETSRAIRDMMRGVVHEEAGTANFADVAGYEVGGKTGTADKAANGGYNRRKTISTFAGAFPMSDPEYILVVTLDEASTFKYGRTWRTAGWTAAPTAGLAVKRLAPILGLRPRPAPPEPPGDALAATGRY